MNEPILTETEAAQAAARLRRQEQEADHARVATKLAGAYAPNPDAATARADALGRLREAEASGDKEAVATLKAALALLR